MTAIERTAYPRFKKTLTQAELDEFYTPTEDEISFVNKAASGQSQQLSLAILLKSFQKLGYLPKLGQVPKQIQKHVAEKRNNSPQVSQGMCRAVKGTVSASDLWLSGH